MLKNLASCIGDEGVAWIADFAQHGVHCFGCFIRRMPCDILGQRPAIDFAAGFLHAPREAFSGSKNLVGNGNGCFHTNSMTEYEAPRWRVEDPNRELLL